MRWKELLNMYRRIRKTARVVVKASLPVLISASLAGCVVNERDVQLEGDASVASEPHAAIYKVSSELVVVPGLDEPLVRTSSTSSLEDQSLKDAVAEFRTFGAATPAKDVLQPFERFVSDYPRSGWTASILTNLGITYYRWGYFSRALDAWTAAWKIGKTSTAARGKVLVDRAVGELVRMHARVGHAAELEKLFKEIGNRSVTGPATEMMAGAREGAWEMRHHAGDAYLCGPAALGNVLRALGGSPASAKFANAAVSGPNGFTLEEVGRLADQSGIAHRLIYRARGQKIPVPSVVNWKVNHYAAIVSEHDGLYRVQDPTFGRELTVSEDAIDAEGSGFFLVPAGGFEDPAWRDASDAEARSVFGKGFTGSGVEGAISPDDTKIDGSCPDSIGMCVPNAHAMNVSLNLNDTPIGYAPQRGPSVYTRVTFNQRDMHQPSNFAYFNIGSKWTVNYLSFVQDDITMGPGVNVSRYLQGGGDKSYTGFTASTGEFLPEQRTGAVLKLVLNGTWPNAYYTLTLADGSVLTYSSPDTALTGTRRVFLSQIADPQGQVVSLFYDSNMRLTRVEDANHRATTFSYTDAIDSRLLTGIADPFGRTSSLIYTGPSGSRRLQTIVDVIEII